MLLEVGFVFSVYLGFRLSEHFNKKPPTRNLSVIKRQSENTQVQITEFTKNNEIANHYLKVSTVHFGLAAVRQFIYPPIAPLYFIFFTYNCFPLYRRAEKSLLQEKKFGMDALTTFGTAVGLTVGQYFAMGLGAFLYFLSEKIIVITQRQSKMLLENTFGQLPRTVWCLIENEEVEMPLEAVKVNDIVVVTIGLTIPIDGMIVDGTAMIDQHTLTGESQPTEKGVGEEVFATTIVISGKILVKTEKTGSETTVAKINQILNYSAQFKNKTQLLGEKWADKGALPFFGLYLLITPILGSTAGLVILTGYFGGRIKVLAPLGTFAHLKRAAQKGILIKEGRALEDLMQIDTILFDKTGTLTNNKLYVSNYTVCDGYAEEDLLTYAAAAESKMSHPIAKAILTEASHLTLPTLNAAAYQVGLGITVNIKNQLIQVGSARFMKSEDIALPEKIEQAMIYAQNQGYSLVIVAVNRQIIGAIELQSVIRAEVKQLVAQLRQHGIRHIAIVSGDLESPTKQLAEKLGMDDYFAEVLPQDKANIVEQLQDQGKSVCFVGDGINDVVAMKKANVSISLAGASSMATDIAEVVLMEGTLHHLADLFEIAKKLEINLQTSLGISFIPTTINFTGAFLFHLGYTTAIVIKNLVFFIGLGYAMLPLIHIPSSEDGKVISK